MKQPRGSRPSRIREGRNSPLLGIEEEGCDIYADLECADRYLGK